MTSNLELMRAAKAQLRGKWLKAALATLIYTVLVGAAGAIIPGLGSLIVGGPLTLGYIFFLKAIHVGKEPEFESLFAGFKTFVQPMLAYLVMSLLVCIGMIFLIVPGIILALGFGMTMFIVAEDPKASGIDALSKSWNMMRGHKWSFFCLQLRFIGWWLLTGLTFGILAFWVQPYVMLASLNFYEELKKQEKK